MYEPERIQLGDWLVEIDHLDYRALRRGLVLLTNVAAPVLGAGGAELAKDDNPRDKLQDKLKEAHALAQGLEKALAGVSEEHLDKLEALFLPKSRVKKPGEKSEWTNLENLAPVVFSGPKGLAYNLRWLAAAVKVNYAPFFTEIGQSFGSRSAAPEDPTQAPR